MCKSLREIIYSLVILNSISVLSTNALAFSDFSASTQMFTPKYKVSDEDMNRIIVQLNKYEQCVYPMIKTANGEQDKLKEIYSKIQKDPNYDFVKDGVIATVFMELPNIIGRDNADLLLNDPGSIKYFDEQFQKLNHSNPAEIETAMESYYCSEILRSIGGLQLLNLKYEMIEAKQESRKNQSKE